jgi:ABC-type polar amino acid transport system ATPase subunit
MRWSRLLSPDAPAASRRDNVEQEAYDILHKLGISHLAMSFLDQLSGGQKQLIGLAQSLIASRTFCCWMSR